MSKHILRLTENRSTVKVNGSTETIALNTDLKKDNEDVTGTPIVTIYGVTSSGNFEIKRNSATILKNTAGQMFNVDFSQMECVDWQESTSDLEVIAPAGSQVYIMLRKESGYSTMIQPEIYGQYDNTLSVS